MIRFLILAVLCCSCSGMNKYFGLKDDNIVEEMVEEFVKEETGINVDFTPFSHE